MKPYYEEDGITIYHADCRDVLPSLNHQAFVIADPPYGSNTDVDNRRFSGGFSARWWNRQRGHDHMQTRIPIADDNKPFDPSLLLAFSKLVLFGANWYASRLPDSGGWLVWDKRLGIENVEWPIGECELAWSNLCQTVHIFRNRWMGLVRDSERRQHFHPTQKPVALMLWILERWGAASDLVIDPYAGSGTTLIAAKNLGRKAIGIEIEERYCEIAAKRLSQRVFQFESAAGK